MSRSFANFLLLIAAVFWGTGNVAQQTVLEHIGPLMTTGLKSLIAAIVILPYCLREVQSSRPMDRDGILLGFVVILSFAAATTLMQIGYGLTTVTNAGFLVNTATVLTPILAWVLLRQQPANVIWLAATATFFGAILMSGGRMTAMSAGDLVCLAAAFCFAVWMVALGGFVSRYARVGLITIAQFVVTGLICTIWALAQEVTNLPDLHAAAPELLYIGVISTGGAYLLQGLAQRYTSSSEAAVIVSAEAVFGAIAAMIILGEQLSFVRAAGALLICASILMLQIPPKRVSRSAIPLSPSLTPGE